MQSGAGSGGALDADPLPDPDAGSRDDVAVDAGQVPVAGDDTVAVAKGNDVPVIPVPISAESRFRQRRQRPAQRRAMRRGLGRCAAATPYIWGGNDARTAEVRA